MKIGVIYWSGTGNTEMMANAVADGARAAGAEVDVMTVSETDAAGALSYDALALGCPAMGDEVLEETIVEPFVAEVEKFASGKKIGLFGSYGWGDGEWMRNWAEQMKNAGAEVFGGEDAICVEAPDGEAEEKCMQLGKQLASC